MSDKNKAYARWFMHNANRRWISDPCCPHPTRAAVADWMDEAWKEGYSAGLRAKLRKILAIIDGVEIRAMATDGPVPNTRDEMTDAELRRIYRLAGGKVQRKAKP